MKIRNRDLNLFSMSALDLFASALGAFIVLAVIALPFFPNTHMIDDEALAERATEAERELEQAQTELAAERAGRAEAEASLAQCEANLEQAEAALEAGEEALAECERAAQANFLLVLISWPTDDDVDLHVTDPAGREFYYDQPQHAGTEARFEEDNTRGPGNEVWVHPNVTPGEYKIEYNMYTKRSGPAATVRGAALHRDGRSEFPNINLRQTGERRLAGTIVVDRDGNIELR